MATRNFSNIIKFLHDCYNTTDGVFSNTAFTVTNILLLLPLYTFIFHLGVQRWRRGAGAPSSHSDVFTYNMVAIELMSILGSLLICGAVFADLPMMLMSGLLFFSPNITGQMFLHFLTCLERYLAVVHPVTYRNLRTEKGARIRNISIGSVWAVCIISIGTISMDDPHTMVLSSTLTISFELLLVSFISLSVLYVLIRPGPGEEGGARQRVDQSKLKAFYTIVAILGVLTLRLLSFILAGFLFTLQKDEKQSCGAWFSITWCGIPCSCVLPLLFLHRAGQLPCQKISKNESKK
ncbi:uncharacterized protein V6R79_012006 [Siganus canaliculatus]